MEQDRSLRWGRLILPAALWLAFLAFLFITPISVSAEASPFCCTPLSGENVNYQNYFTWSSPVDSYLTVSGSRYMRVQGNVKDQDGVVVCYYDSGFNLLSRKVIAQELPYFGGFYESSGNYFLVTGQSNKEESDAVEVFRITKYDKEWNRIGSCSLYGANTYYPFDAGSCRMDMDGKYLLIRTCHEMYASYDGLHHQANVTIEVDTEAMTVTDSYYEVMNIRVGYVSHSFNQFIRLENHHIISVDHGDAHPRAICLMIYPTDVTTGQFQAEYFDDPVTTIYVHSFQGESGTNYTGASVGGLEISPSSYLIAGNSVVQDEQWLDYDTRNIFVVSVDKSTREKEFRWITHYAEGTASASTPHLVPVASGKYLLLWTRKDGQVYYTFLSADGKPGEIYSMEGELSDCVPVVSGGKVIWYTWDDGTETFYQIPVSSPEKPMKRTLSFDHDYQYVSTRNGHVTFKCSKCGEVKEGEAPVSFYVCWKKSGDGAYYYYSVPSGLAAGDSLDFFVSGFSYGIENPSVIYSEMTGMTSDAANCVLDMDQETVALKKPGTYTVTFSPKYNPEVKKEYTITVAKPLTSVKLSSAVESPQTYGTSVKLTARADGGIGTLTYKFTAVGSDGKRTVLQNSQENTCQWNPSGAGKYELKVEAVDPLDDDKSVESEKMDFTISRKSLREADVSGIKTMTYTGKALKPSPVVELDGTTLTAGTDYSVSYKNNKNTGKASVIISGKGNYTGKISKGFYIKPAMPRIISAENTGKRTIVVKWDKAASGTGYLLQYGLKKNFKGAETVTISKRKTTAKKIRKLTRNKTYYVRIRVYKTVGEKTIYSKWSPRKSIRIRK